MTADVSADSTGKGDLCEEIATVVARAGRAFREDEGILAEALICTEATDAILALISPAVGGLEKGNSSEPNEARPASGAGPNSPPHQRWWDVADPETVWRVCRSIEGECGQCEPRITVGDKTGLRGCYLQAVQCVNIVETGNPRRAADGVGYGAPRPHTDSATTDYEPPQPSPSGSKP